MDIFDYYICPNKDWDPSYLAQILLILLTYGIGMYSGGFRGEREGRPPPRRPLHIYRNIVNRGEMEHEMTSFHAIEPIKKCFVPDTPFL